MRHLLIALAAALLTTAAHASDWSPRPLTDARLDPPLGLVDPDQVRRSTAGEHMERWQVDADTITYRQAPLPLQYADLAWTRESALDFVFPPGRFVDRTIERVADRTLRAQATVANGLTRCSAYTHTGMTDGGDPPIGYVGDFILVSVSCGRNVDSLKLKAARNISSVTRNNTQLVEIPENLHSGR